MLSMLIAYDGAGNVIATLDYMVARTDTAEGLIDFAAHEEAGGKLRDVWDVRGAVGSTTWPEWIGSRAHDFRVELNAEKQAVALVHRTSGRRRERAAIEAAIAERIAAASGEPADIRDIVGGPDRPLRLDDDGRPAAGPVAGPATRPNLPLVAMR